jgi:uncharacterized protein YkwD
VTRQRTVAGCVLGAGLLALTACTRVGGPVPPSGPSPQAGENPPVDPPSSGPVPGTPEADVCPAGAERSVLELMNRIRAEERARMLGLDARLQRAARAHARDLATGGGSGHRGHDGSQPADRARRAGYEWRSVGENVASGYATPSMVVDGWMTSPGHRENILEPGFRDVGIAFLEAPGSRWRTYWVVLFGASDAARQAPSARCDPGVGPGGEHPGSALPHGGDRGPAPPSGGPSSWPDAGPASDGR